MARTLVTSLFSPSCRRLSSVCVCVGGLFSLSLVQFLSQHFFLGGGWEPNRYFTFAFVHPLFFSISYFSSTPFVDLFYIRQFQLPFILFFTRPLYLFFLYLLCGRVRLIYIYIHILLCVRCILSLGRKKKKQQLFSLKA